MQNAMFGLLSGFGGASLLCCIRKGSDFGGAKPGDSAGGGNVDWRTGDSIHDRYCFVQPDTCPSEILGI